MSAPPLDACSLDDLCRRARDPDPSVWEPAARGLGERAAEDEDARAEVDRLIEAPLAEVRLRGATAWLGLARHRPEEAEALVASWVAAGDDPVLLETALGILPLLPEPRGADLWSAYLRDPREAVRAAAAAGLSAWPDLSVPPEMARDPSPLVRAALASALPADSALWEDLAAAPEGWFRAFVADALRSVDAQAGLLERLAADPDPLVREAACGSVPQRWAAPSALAEALALEALLDARPEAALDGLRPYAERVDVAELLQRVAHLARDRGVAALCRGLHALVTTGGRTAVERLDPVAVALADSDAHLAAAAFGRMVLACRRAADAAAVDDLAACADGAPTGLEEVARHAACGALSDAVLALEAAARADFGWPEGAVLAPVVDAWGEILDAEIERRVRGMES